LPEPTIVSFGLDALAAVAHVHGRGFVAVDLAPRSWMISGCGLLKLSDLGASRHLTEAGGLRGGRALGPARPPTPCPPATPQAAAPPPDALLSSLSQGYPASYLAPELLRQREAEEPPPVFSHASDFWSLGTLLYHFATGAPPPHPPPAVLQRPPLASAELVSLVSWLLEPHPLRRPRWEELRTHALWCGCLEPHAVPIPFEPLFEQWKEALRSERRGSLLRGEAHSCDSPRADPPRTDPPGHDAAGEGGGQSAVRQAREATSPTEGPSSGRRSQPRSQPQGSQPQPSAAETRRQRAAGRDSAGRDSAGRDSAGRDSPATAALCRRRRCVVSISGEAQEPTPPLPVEGKEKENEAAQGPAAGGSLRGDGGWPAAGSAAVAAAEEAARASLPARRELEASAVAERAAACAAAAADCAVLRECAMAEARDAMRDAALLALQPWEWEVQPIALHPSIEPPSDEALESFDPRALPFTPHSAAELRAMDSAGVEAALGPVARSLGGAGVGAAEKANTLLYCESISTDARMATALLNGAFSPPPTPKPLPLLSSPPPPRHPAPLQVPSARWLRASCGAPARRL